jgi:LEA14-like dessication related protein
MKTKEFIRVVCLALVVMMLGGCDAAKQLQGAYNLAHCDYKYNSIGNLNLSGMNLSNGISAVNAVRLLSVLNTSSKSIPLAFTLNLDVHNPNATHAYFNSLHYIIQIDDIDFTEGDMAKPFSVNSGETQLLPVEIGVDLASLITKHSAETVFNMTKNFIGLGDAASKVTVQLKPTFNVAGVSIASPVYIPVSFSFSGRK